MRLVVAMATIIAPKTVETELLHIHWLRGEAKEGGIDNMNISPIITYNNSIQIK